MPQVAGDNYAKYYLAPSNKISILLKMRTDTVELVVLGEWERRADVSCVQLEDKENGNEPGLVAKCQCSHAWQMTFIEYFGWSTLLRHTKFLG